MIDSQGSEGFHATATKFIHQSDTPIVSQSACLPATTTEIEASQAFFQRALKPQVPVDVVQRPDGMAKNLSMLSHLAEATAAALAAAVSIGEGLREDRHL